jgi:hypothetical protein
VTEYSDLAYSLAGVRRTNPYDRRRIFAQTMQRAGADYSPVDHPLQGAARLAQALVGGWMSGKADRDEAEAVKKRETSLAAAMAETDPQKRIAMLAASDPELGARLSGQLAVEQAKIAQQQQGLQTAAGNFGGSFGAPPTPGAPPTGNAQTAISGIESGGRYDAVGPETGKGRALGKYQVMPFNVGPWTKEALGREMTPQEFLANPQAQDAVFNHKFGQYVQQYGSPQAAARAWFAGPGGMNNPNARDALGTSVADYSQKFNAAYGQSGGPPVQVAQGSADGSGNPLPPPGMPPAPQPSAVNGPTMVAPTPPQIPDVPRPQPTPQQLAQYQQRLASGEFGTDPREAPSRARAALDAELDRDWAVQRDRAKMQFGQETTLYNEQRKLENEKNNPKFTEDANKAHAYAIRLGPAIQDLEGIINRGELPGTLSRGVVGLPLLGNTLAGPQGERFDQTARDIINAILRRQSGATITKEEFANAYQQYIPQPGESPSTTQQKMANLRRELKAMADAAGRTPDVYGMFGSRGATIPPEPTPTPATAAPMPGAVEGGYRFKGGNPADQRNWERVQ